MSGVYCSITTSTARRGSDRCQPALLSSTPTRTAARKAKSVVTSSIISIDAKSCDGFGLWLEFAEGPIDDGKFVDVAVGSCSVIFNDGEFEGSTLGDCVIGPRLCCAVGESVVAAPVRASMGSAVRFVRVGASVLVVLIVGIRESGSERVWDALCQRTIASTSIDVFDSETLGSHEGCFVRTGDLIG